MVFEKLPASKKTGCLTSAEKAAAISAISWRASDANLKLLEILGIDPAIFNPPVEDDTTIVPHQAGKRFYELLDYQFVIKQRVLSELNKPFPLKRMLVHMPTGTGKTKTTMHTLVHYYNFTVVYLCSSQHTMLVRTYLIRESVLSYIMICLPMSNSIIYIYLRLAN